MSLQYIRDTYNVPARVGGRIEYSGDRGREKPQVGTITGARGPHLCVVLDEDEDHERTYHPTWEIRYL